MYLPIGWPKVINTPQLGQANIKQIICNRDRILFVILTDDSVSIWFCKPCVPIVFHRRSSQSLEKFGTNILVEWKPDSSMLVIGTSEGHLVFYKLGVDPDQKGLYVQTDSPHANLRRDSAELFIKEIIPPLKLTINDEIMVWDGNITGIVCITMSEIMVATSKGHVLRYKWDGTQNRDYNLDLRRIPFCINQQVSKAVPIVEENIFIIDIEYSPLVGGFSIVLNDGRAAFLTATTLKFDPNQAQGIWAQNIEDATCTTVNHKYRLITFGRTNSECVVYYVDESTGGLEVSHNCILSSKDFPGDPGPIKQVLWTPDGRALVASWEKGGLAVWSTFGTLLMCSLGWDYGLNVDILRSSPLKISSMQFGCEGYQLWMVHKDVVSKSNLIQLDFVKSALTTNPCMSHLSHLYLQGEDKLYLNSADSLIKMFADRTTIKDENFGESVLTSTLAEGRQWVVIPIPSTYSATNWPIRFSAIDSDGQNLVVAGRTGIAHYSMQTRRWKLFGNESQEKDFIVVGGLLWWHDHIVVGCYSLLDNSDELRFYPKDSKLDNKFAKIIKVQSSIVLINSLQDQLITFDSDAQVCIWINQNKSNPIDIDLIKVQAIDISALTVHTACVISLTLTSIRTESGRGQLHHTENIILNVSGRLLMVQREMKNNSGGNEKFICSSMPTVLASCVENVWVPARRRPDKAHLTESLWLFCGAHGMRVWLPLYPRDGDKIHTFMSKRIMLPFHLKIYPLAILFEDAIILGAENDTVLYTSDTNSLFSLPFSVLQRTSQVYLHQILRQLIRRNLGYHAWEIARSCMSLPYFPHSLELLLHEVLEEEATSKEPIPDAQLPSIIEFIMEFPVYLQTVVQCARKTEIALWPYLFSAAGKPKELFQECMMKRQLDTAASYLIILQNLETSSVSRQYATLLLNTALEQSKWELAKDLVRFLRAIDPNDVESPRNSFILPKLGLSQQTPPVSPNAEDLSLILGNVQGPRGRSYSTTISPKLIDNNSRVSSGGVSGNGKIGHESPASNRKKSVPNFPGRDNNINNNNNNNNNNTAEEFFIDVILQKHARRLLGGKRLIDLGYFAAHLDFHLVAWLVKERDRAARIDDFVLALKQLHEEFSWPYPNTEITNDGININIDDRLKLLKIEPSSSRVGDSGYMSFHHGLVTPLDVNSQLDDDHDDVNSNDNDSKIDKTINIFDNNNCEKKAIDDTILSTISSVWGDDTSNNLNINENWEVPPSQILELSNSGQKGSHRSEVQLRYLLQLFMEACCLEWSLIISILLRDAMAVLRTIMAAKSPDQSVESISRLRQGFLLLLYWTNTECLGYKTFMLVVQSQISVLTKILETKIQQQKSLEQHNQHYHQHQHQNIYSSANNKSIITPPNLITRSRKHSNIQQQDNSSQCSSDKNHHIVSNISNCSNNSSKLNDNSNNIIKDKLINNINNTNDDKNAIIPENTGCVIS